MKCSEAPFSLTRRMANFPMANVATDETFLRKALELARAGVGLAAPIRT